MRVRARGLMRAMLVSLPAGDRRRVALYITVGLFGAEIALRAREQPRPRSSGRSSSATLVGQALVGHADFNADQARPPRRLGLWRYVTSSSSASTCSRTGSRSTCSSCSTSSPRSGCSRRARPSPRSSTRPAARATGSRRSAARHRRLAGAGPAAAACDAAVLQLAAGRDGRRSSWRPGSVSPITGRVAYNAEQFDHQQAALAGRSTSLRPTSGTARCRTGSPSSSPSARWPCCRSTSVSAVPGVQAGRRAAHAPASRADAASSSSSARRTLAGSGRAGRPRRSRRRCPASPLPCAAGRRAARGSRRTAAWIGSSVSRGHAPGRYVSPRAVLPSNSRRSRPWRRNGSSTP